MEAPVPYAIAMAIAAGFAAVVVGLALGRRPDPTGRALAFVMLCVAIWSGSLAGEALASAIPAKVLWSKAEYIGVAAFPFALLLFGLSYTERKDLLKPLLLATYGLIPTLTLILAWTNEIHHLLWVDFVREGQPYSSMIRYVHGPWYWVNIGYTYTIALLTALLLLREAFLQWTTFRWQAVALVLAILPPLILSTGYVFGWGHLSTYDLTPIGFIVTGAVLVTGFTHRGLLSAIPVARSRILAYMHAAFLIVGADGTVLDVNDAMCQILEARSSERVALGDYVGRDITSVLAAWPEWRSHLDQAEDAGDDIVAADGRYWEISTAPVPEELGAQVVVVRDVSENVQLQAEAGKLRQQEAALAARLNVEAELQAKAAEVMRHIHAGVRVAQALLEAGRSSDAQVELAQIDDALMSATNDLRAIADSVQALPRFTQDFAVSLTDYVERLQEATGLEVALSLPKADFTEVIDPPMAMALLRTVHDALLNVFVHADVGRAQVVVSQLGPWLQIVVADGGAGFDTLDAEANCGTGGLAKMRRRVEGLNGSLTVSASPGGGTQIILQVPLATDESGPLFPPVRVMLVDDHPLILDGFAELLAARGAQIIGTAHNGREAVEEARKLHPDLVLMDIEMPDLSGIEATARIKAQLPKTKIVMLTASRNKDDLVAAIRAGADGYLVKHLEVDEFVTLLAKIARDEAPIAPGLTDSLLQALVEMDVPNVLSTPDLTLPERQITVLQRAAEGYTYREIGDQLHVTERTVRYHMEQARETLGAANRAEAIAIATQAGLINPVQT